MLYKIRDSETFALYYESENPFVGDANFAILNHKNASLMYYTNYDQAIKYYKKITEKENNMIDLTKNPQGTKIDEIMEMIIKFAQENADKEEIVIRYFEEAKTDSEKRKTIIEYLEMIPQIYADMKTNWEQEELSNTSFDTVRELIDEYNEMKEVFDSIYSLADDIKNRAGDYTN